MRLVAAVEIVRHAVFFALLLVQFLTTGCHVQEGHTHLFSYFAHTADIVLILCILYIVPLYIQTMSAFVVDLSVLEIGAADRRHQDRRHAFLACLADIGAQELLIGRVGLCAAHVGQCILAFGTQLGVLDIHIFSLAFLVVVGKLNNEVVAGVHLCLYGWPEVVCLVERTSARPRFAAVVYLYRIGIKECLQVHAPSAFGRSRRFVFAHRTVTDGVDATRSCR